jgi:hypothetical protein
VRTIALLLSLLGALIVVGCGGGHTKPAVDAEASELGPLPAGAGTLSSSVIQLTPGSEWRYSVTGTLTSATGTVIKLTGNHRITVSAETITPPPTSLYKDEQLHYLLESGTITGTGYLENVTERRFFKQDPDGTIWVYGWYNWTDPESPHWADERYKWVASPLMAGSSWGALVQEGGTLLLDEQWVVTSTDTLTVPAGTCQVYSATGNGRVAGITAENMDMWWAPQIGAPAQVRLTTVKIDGTTERLLFQLASLAVY